MTELIICIKFGKETMTKPLPRHIALWWVLGAALLIIYTFVKFYLLKPEHVPKPEKENIIMGRQEVAYPHFLQFYHSTFLFNRSVSGKGGNCY